MKNTGIKVSLFLTYFVLAALLNSVGILVERAQEVYGVLKSDAAILEPFKDLSIALVSFIIGSFLPRLGYKRGMLLSLTLVFLGCIGMYFGNSFWTVKLLFACTGMSFAVVKVAVYALIGYITETKKEHSQVMSLMEAVFMLGIIFMYVVFPLFFDKNDPDAWLRGYLLMASLIAISFFIILFSKFNIEVTQESSSLKEDIRAMFQLFSKPLIWTFAIFAFFYVMTEQGIMTWLPTFNKETLHLEARLATQMAVILMTSMALGRFLTSLLVKRIPWIYIASTGVFLAAMLVLLVLPMAKDVEVTKVSMFADLPLVSFLFPMIGLFLAPLYPLIISAVLSSTEKAQHSSLSGIVVFFSAIGGTSGSLIIGYMFDVFGGDRVFYLSLIPMTIILLSLFRLRKLTKGITS